MLSVSVAPRTSSAMELATFLLISVLFYSLYVYFKNRLSIFEKHGIPHIPGWPVIGNNLCMLLKLQHPTELLHQVYNLNREAKYVGMFELNRPVIVLRDPELIKAIGITHFENFPDRAFFLDDTVDPLFGNSLFNMLGDRWRKTRSLLSPAFTGSKMKGMFEFMVNCAETFTDYLGKLDQKESRMIDTLDLFTKYTTDVIASCAFGIKLDSLSEPDNEFYVLSRDALIFEKLSFFKLLIARASPTLLKILNLRLFDDRITNFFKNLVSTTISTRDKEGTIRPDMIQLMMDARTKEHQLSIAEMTAQAFIFFLGGFETTSRQLCVIAHELANNQEVQEKLQGEIDEYLEKTEGKITYEAIHEMPYLDAVFSESLRKHTQFINLERKCVKEYELPPTLPGTKPFTLVPGMTVWIPAATIHKDPKYYENPDTFDPERYYLKKKVTANDATTLAFGIGPRACIGNRFAIMEIKILIFHILSKFNFKPNEMTCKTFKYDKKVSFIRPAQGFWLTVEPRNQHKLK